MRWEVGSLQIKAVEQGTTQEYPLSYMDEIGGNSVAPAIDNTISSAENSMHAGSLFDLFKKKKKLGLEKSEDCKPGRIDL